MVLLCLNHSCAVYVSCFARDLYAAYDFVPLCIRVCYGFNHRKATFAKFQMSTKNRRISRPFQGFSHSACYCENAFPWFPLGTFLSGFQNLLDSLTMLSRTLMPRSREPSTLVLVALSKARPLNLGSRKPNFPFRTLSFATTCSIQSRFPAGSRKGPKRCFPEPCLSERRTALETVTLVPQEL